MHINPRKTRAGLLAVMAMLALAACHGDNPTTVAAYAADQINHLSCSDLEPDSIEDLKFVDSERPLNIDLLTPGCTG